MNTILKRVLLCLLAFCFINQCKQNKRKEGPLLIDVNVNSHLDSCTYTYTHDKYFCDSVSLDLFNNTDTAFSFWVMKCSWERNWISNCDSICVAPNNCFGDYPYLFKIQPKQTKTFKGILAFKEHEIKLDKEIYQLGFVLIMDGELSRDRDFDKVLNEKIKNKRDIIWSNFFGFKK